MTAGWFCVLFRGEGINLTIEIGEGLLQHLTVPSVGGGFQLFGDAGTRKPQAF